MLRELRLFLRLQPFVKKIIDQLEGTKAMKLSINAVIQLLGTAAQGLVAITDFLPPRAKLWIAIAMSAIQGVVGVLAHFANPDGTPASVAYRPAP